MRWNLPPYIRRRLIFCAWCVILFLVWPVSALNAAETVHVPITLDYPLIRSLLINQVYTQPGERASLTDKDTGCVQVELWEPEVTQPSNMLVALSAGISARKPGAFTTTSPSSGAAPEIFVTRLAVKPVSPKCKARNAARYVNRIWLLL